MKLTNDRAHVRDLIEKVVESVVLLAKKNAYKSEIVEDSKGQMAIHV